jgi:hypothetical protein
MMGNNDKPRTGVTTANEIEQCCPNTEIRRISRSVYEPARNAARAIAKTPAYRRRRRHRT